MNYWEGPGPLVDRHKDWGKSVKFKEVGKAKGKANKRIIS